MTYQWFIGYCICLLFAIAYCNYVDRKRIANKRIQELEGN